MYSNGRSTSQFLIISDIEFGNGQLVPGGDDVLFGGAGKDTLHGGLGDDALYGEVGNDQLFGGAGGDTLDGRLGNNVLRGGDGDDFLVGGNGFDRMFGEAGADGFIFSSLSSLGFGTQRDRIGDFKQGIDRIDLRGIGLELGASLHLQDNLGAVHSGPAGELRAVQTLTGNTALTLDVDGDGSADHAILLMGLFTMTDSDSLF